MKIRISLDDVLEERRKKKCPTYVLSLDDNNISVTYLGIDRSVVAELYFVQARD